MDAADDWFGDEGDFGFQVDQQPVAHGEGEFEDHYGDHLDNNNGNENSDIDIDLGLDNSQEINGELAEEDWDNHDNLDNDSVLSDSEEDDPFDYRDLPLEPEEGTESEEEEHYHINRPPRYLQQSPHSPQSPSSSESSLVDADPGFDIDLDLPYDVDHDSGLDIPGFYSSDDFQSDTDLDQDSENDDDNNNNNNNEEDEDRDQDSEDNENTSSDNDSDNDSDLSLDRRLREQFDIFEASARIEARLDELEQRRQLFVQGLNEARRQYESIAEQQNRRDQNHHHPYRVPALLDRRRAQQAQQQQEGGGRALGLGAGEGAGPAAAPRGQDLAVNELDELVEMEVGWPAGQGGGGNAGGQSNNNDNPAQVVIDLTSDLEELPVQHRGEIRRGGRSIGRRTAPVAPEDRAALLAARRARREMSANNANNNNGGPAQAGNGFPEVIDLTLDDDDPAPAAGPDAGHHHHNNRRRGNVERSRRPVNRRPAANELIVDLGEVDSDDDDAIARAAHRSAARNAAARPQAAARAARANAAAAGGGGGGVGGFIATLLRMRGFAGVPAVAADLEVQLLGLEANNPLGQNLPNFDYGNNGRNGRAAAAAAAAAAAEAQRNANEPPPAREGFTRATGEDLAVVCPSCEEELSYDPDEEEQQKAGGPPAKRPRNKKDREEHFFWAVKECGHVYCKKCFENRKCTKNTGFKAKDQGSSSASGAAGSSGAPAAKQKVIVCAVEDCSAEVGYKGHWVGLFL